MDNFGDKWTKNEENFNGIYAPNQFSHDTKCNVLCGLQSKLYNFI